MRLAGLIGILGIIGAGSVIGDDRVPGDGWSVNAPAHPDYLLQDIKPSGWNVRVGGMDFLSDGRMVISDWGADMAETGKLLILSNVTSGNGNQVQAKEIVTQLKEPLGIKVVNDEIYFLSKKRLGKVTNYDSNNPTVETVVEGWDYPTDGDRGSCGCERWHLFAFGLVHKVEDGKDYFYGTLGGEYPPSGTQGGDRGSLIKMDPENGSFEVIAGGLRTPNGVEIGPDGEIFQAENQGHWVPADKLNVLRQGGFYGMQNDRSNPFHRSANQQDPPAIWIPYPEVGKSNGEPLYIRDGIFKGQMFITDVSFGGLQRIFLERVNGMYQGAIFHHSGGFEAGTNRIEYGPDSAIYVGQIGSNSNWHWNNRQYGLQRMSWKGTVTFEMLAIRSISNNEFEIEFTGEVGNSASNLANYDLERFSYVPEETYGGGKQPNENVVVEAVTVSEDKKKVTLRVNNIPKEFLGTVVYFNIRGVTSADGKTPLNDEAWYTLHDYGPAEKGGCTDPAYEEYSADNVYDDGISCLTETVSIKKEQNILAREFRDMGMFSGADGKLWIYNPLSQETKLEVFNMRGRKVLEMVLNSKEKSFIDLQMERGLYQFKFKSGPFEFTQPWVKY